MENCLFCKIIAGEIPATKMYEDEIARLRVESPELSDEYEDDEEFFENRFASSEDGEDL